MMMAQCHLEYSGLRTARRTLAQFESVLGNIAGRHVGLGIEDVFFGRSWWRFGIDCGQGFVALLRFQRLHKPKKRSRRRQRGLRAVQRMTLGTL